MAGQIADGWPALIPSYLPYDQWAPADILVDDGARNVGHDPRQVLGMAQLVGTVTEHPGAAGARTESYPMRGTVRQWAKLIARLDTEHGAAIPSIHLVA